MTVRVGVIGAGIMGADHARTLDRSVARAQVELVADVDPARADAVASELPGVRATDDAHALIEDPQVDAVVIASHDTTHGEFTAAAVRAGKPVLCEKPLAPSLAEAVDLVESAGADGARLISVGFMRRFDPGYAQLKEAIATRAFGSVLLVHCTSRGVTSGPGTTSEFSVIGSAIHEFDIVPWLLDSAVVEVGWHAPRSTSLVEGLQDPQVMTLRTADGVLSTVETFLNARYGYDIRCEVVGETGAVSLAEPVRSVADADRRRAITYAADWRLRFADAYRLELQAWVDGIERRTPSPLADARDGVGASAVADAVITSMHHGGRLTEVERPALAAFGA